MKIAIIAHLYYLDLAPEFKKYFQNIPFKFDFYITTSRGSKGKLQKIFLKGINNLNRLIIIDALNCGRDIGPFLLEFKKYYQDYDFVCKVHGKKSPQNLNLFHWRAYLLNNLLGSKKYIKEIINILKTNKKIGVVYPESYYVVNEVNKIDPWRSNWKNCKVLAQRMGVNLNKDIEYPAGSMFWFRPKALKPLFNLDLKYSDFEEGGGKTDGMLAHAVERLFTASAYRSGLKEKKILFDSSLNKLISKQKKQNKVFYKMTLLVKKYFIFKLPYSWQIKIFRFFNKKIKH